LRTKPNKPNGDRNRGQQQEKDRERERERELDSIKEEPVQKRRSIYLKLYKNSDRRVRRSFI